MRDPAKIPNQDRLEVGAGAGTGWNAGMVVGGVVDKAHPRSRLGHILATQDVSKPGADRSKLEYRLTHAIFVGAVYLDVCGHVLEGNLSRWIPA